jgi:hypothetical protein
MYMNQAPKEAPVASNLKAIVVFVNGKAETQKNGQKSGLHIGDILQTGDSIITGASSQVDISLSDNAVVRIRQNTSIVLSEAVKTTDGGERIKMDLTSGSTLNHIKKLSAEDHYMVHTPTAIASVRGTAFEITSGEKQSVISVGQGKVQVNEINHQKAEYILEKNRGVTVTKDPDEIQDLADASETQQSEIDDIYKNIEAMGADSRKMTDGLADVSTEADLKKAYKRDIEQIELKDGRILRGVIVSMNEGKLLVQTVDGSHLLNESAVLRVMFVQQ